MKEQIYYLEQIRKEHIFLISNDKVLTKQKDIQDSKIIVLIKSKGIVPENVIGNSLSYVLPDNYK